MKYFSAFGLTFYHNICNLRLWMARQNDPRPSRPKNLKDEVLLGLDCVDLVGGAA